jgi:hypothetical protein
MNLFELYNLLPCNIQSLIKVYYLSFGTPVVNILRIHFHELQYNYSESNISIWRHKMQNKEIKEIFSRGYSGLKVAAELNIAFLQDEHDSLNKIVFLREKHDTIQMVFTLNLNRIINFNNKIYGTPTSIIMRQTIPNFRKYADTNLPSETLWKIRVKASCGVLTDKKIYDLKPVCNPEVYNYLTAAFREN